ASGVRVPVPLDAGRCLRRLLPLRLGPHREPAARGGRDLRRAALLLGGHVERGSDERGDAAPPPALLALRPLLHLRARRGGHRQRELPRPLHGGVSLLHVLRARRPPLARGPLMALTRAARSWSQLVLQVLLLLTGLGLLQVVAERTNHRFDLTPGRELSLSPVTQKVLGQAREPLRITVFFRRGTKEQYAQLLERLRVLNRKVEFELYDLDRYPKGGGGVLLFLDPAPLPNLTRFLASTGIRLGDDFVVDREKRVLGTDGLAAVVELFKQGNPVSDPSANPIQSGAVLPSARTVDVAAEGPGVDAESIARTAPTAWAMADPARAQRGAEPSKAHHDTPGSASVVVMA